MSIEKYVLEYNSNGKLIATAKVWENGSIMVDVKMHNYESLTAGWRLTQRLFHEGILTSGVIELD